MGIVKTTENGGPSGNASFCRLARSRVVSHQGGGREGRVDTCILVVVLSLVNLRWLST